MPSYYMLDQNFKIKMGRARQHGGRARNYKDINWSTKSKLGDSDSGGSIDVQKPRVKNCWMVAKGRDTWRRSWKKLRLNQACSGTDDDN